MEDLRVVLDELSELGSGDSGFFEVGEDGDEVLADAAAEHEGVLVDVVDGEAEFLEELDALGDDVDGGRELD